MFRLAHFSDIHYTLPPFSLPTKAMLNKRAFGISSYYFSGRGRHFAHTDQRIPALLADADAQNVDHVLCTGDLTAISADEELQGCAAAFGERLEQPARYTVIPGNHDRYVRSAVSERLFERRFETLCEGAEFPFEKRVGPVRFVAIDVTRPTGMSSAGKCGDEQLQKLRALLAKDRARENDVTILVLHYGLLRPGGVRDSRHHGIEDDLALLALIDSDDVRVDLVLHGHIHRAYIVKTERRYAICAGSATDLHIRCGYNVYTIDPATRRLSLERRDWNGSAYATAPDRAATLTF
jgi:3',5'-cyclic AMP phosphodiesterase CpdA